MKVINIEQTIKNQKEEQQRQDMLRGLEGLAARSSGVLVLHEDYYKQNQPQESSTQQSTESGQGSQK